MLDDILGHCVKEGGLRIADREDGRGRPTLVELPDGKGWSLSRAGWRRLLRDVPVEPREP